MKIFKNPRLIFILSMVIFGTLGLFVRNIPISSGELALYRAVLAVILIGTYLLITKRTISFKNLKKEIPLLVISGIAIGVNWILLFEAYKYTTVSVATLSYYFAPVIVMILCPIIFKEKLTIKQIICFIMSTLGLVLITGIGDVNGSNHFIGILFGLGAAVFYASVIILNKFIKNVEGIHRTFLQFISAIIVLFPYVLLTSGITVFSLNATGLINLLAVGLIHTGITYCMYFSSLKELPGQESAILSYFDPLVAVIISVTLLGESMTLMQVIGGLLILGFTIFNEIKFKQKQFIARRNMLAEYKYINDDVVASVVTFCKESTPVWRQNRWNSGEYQEFIVKNGCGHCCTAMALNLHGIKITPHEEFALCRKLWGAPVREREFPQDNLQSVAGITKILKYHGVKAEYFGVYDLKTVKEHFERSLKEGKQIIFWSHPTESFKENPFSQFEHYVMAVGYTKDNKILVANSSEKWAEEGVQIVDIETILKALFLGASPIDMTWGERDHYINCSGYVVVG